MRFLSLLLLLACTPPEAEREPEPEASIAPVVTASTTIRLVTVEAELALPPSNLPPGRLAGVVPLREPFVAGPSFDEGDTWTSGLPAGVPADDPDLSLVGPGGPLPRSETPRPGTWTLVDGRVVLRVARGKPAPVAKAHKLRSDALARAEGRLSLASSGLEPRAFAFGRIGGDDGEADGIYLPAPASATFTLDVPLGAVFDAEVRVVPSPVPGGTDGATLVLEVLTDAGARELGRVEVGRDGAALRLPLDGVAGPGTRLRLRTDPGVTRFHDYVQVVDPVVIVPRPDARRVVLIQVPALRAAEAGPAAPGGLGALPASSIRFTSAWTTAPWSLPATKAVLAGDHPERATERPTLAERLAAAGFATAALLDDPGLVGPDGVRRGFVRARSTAGRPAAEVATLAESWLTGHVGRDALLLVQLGDLERALPLDPKAPMTGEPWSAPAGARPAARAQVLADVGAAVDRIVAAAGPGAWVFAYADHGVELVGSRARHADRLVDDVVRVPLVARVPGVPAGSRDVPVSLVDLTPTVLAALGQAPPADVAGRSLLPLLTEPPGDATALLGRPLVFGRARGDDTAWGVVDHGVVWRVGDPVVPGTNPEVRLEQALGPGVRAKPSP